MEEENYPDRDIKDEPLDYDTNTNAIVKWEEVSGSYADSVPNFGNSGVIIKREVEETDDMKDKPEHYDANHIVKKEETLKSEEIGVHNFGHSNGIIKVEEEENDNLKEEPEYCNANKIDFKSMKCALRAAISKQVEQPRGVSDSLKLAPPPTILNSQLRFLHTFVPEAITTGFDQCLPRRSMISTKVEKESDVDSDVDIKYESLDFGLERPTLQNSNKKSEVQFKCYQCNYQSKYKARVKNHICAIHQTEKAPRYACKLCSYRTIHKRNLKKHIIRIHKEGTPRYECKLCPYETVDKEYLNRHIRRKHEKEKATRYACKLCRYDTTQSSSLKQHILRVHENIKGPIYIFHCDSCSYKTIYKEFLVEHSKQRKCILKTYSRRTSSMKSAFTVGTSESTS